MEKIITYCGQPMKVACDERCDKAWGINTRPRVQVSTTDPDAFYWKPDQELGTAPVDPGTMEGDDRKPVDKVGIPNRWCIRECERCACSMPGKSQQPLELPDMSVRKYNKPPQK